MTSSDDDQAIEAAKRYYAAFNQAIATRDTTEMRKNFLPGCLICESDAEQIDSMARKGQRVIGGNTTLTNLKITWRKDHFVDIHADAFTEAAVIENSDGTVASKYEAAHGGKTLSLVKTQGAWRVQGLS